jgi:hypothetical protein
MPTYLEGLRVDWGWKALRESERAIARKLGATLQADPSTHTIETFKKFLCDASQKLEGRSIRGRGSDDTGDHIWSAFRGACRNGDSYDPSGEFPDVMTADDYRAAGVTMIETPLYWPVDQLAAVIARAAELDVSISRLVQRAWAIASDRELPDVSSPGDKRAQSIYLPIEIWGELTLRSQTLDRSKSWLMQRVVAAAWDEL